MSNSIEKLNLLLLTAKKSCIIQKDEIRFVGFRYFYPNLIAYVGLKHYLRRIKIIGKRS